MIIFTLSFFQKLNDFVFQLDKVVISFGSSSKATTKHAGSGTTKHNGGSTDAALQTLVDKMWGDDQDRPSATQVTMNWGEHISGKTGTKGAK